MSIRVKFLLVLLIAVLMPTAFAALIGFQSTTQMARTVAADQRTSLLREAESVLLAVTRKNVGFFEQATTAFVAGAELQARDAAWLLEDDEPPTAEHLPPSAFREGGGAPGLAPSETHLVLREDGTTVPATVSFDAPAIYIAPGGNTEDADRLAGLASTFQILSPTMSRSAYWQFVTLDSGVHAVYPGHGLLPDGYDARTDPVFERGRARIGRGYGSPPSVDTASGQTLVGVIRPVTDAEGNPIGLTGVLSRVDAILDGLRLGTNWGDTAENMLVAINRDGDGVEAAFIIAKRDFSETDQHQTGFLGVEAFRTDDPDITAQIVSDIRIDHSATQLVTIDGKPMLCCYAGLTNSEVGLISLVPTASIGLLADQAAQQIQRRAVNQLVGIVIGVVVFSLAMTFSAFLGARVVTQPIATLAAAIRRVAAGDLDVQAEVSTRDEVGELAEAFNGMVPRLRDHLRLSHSLDLAQQVQRKLLPAEPPNVAGFDIAARSNYCDETGGDYFDFIEFDQPAPERLTVAVGDVTGHGIAAALLMATARALIRMRTGMPGELAESLADINHHLASDADGGRFMTLMVIVFDHLAGTARWVGAGHDPVLVYDPEADDFFEWEGEDIPLAIDGNWTFHEQTSDALRPGLVLFLGTDGIWETFNADDEPYGKERLRACIRAHADRTADEIVGAIIRDVDRFRGDHPQLDDITLVVIRVTETP